MSRSRPAWHAEALALRKQGVPVVNIAKQMGHTISGVKYAIDENNERAANKRRAQVYNRCNKNSGITVTCEETYTKPYVSRVKRNVLKRDAIRPAAYAFARGDIDRAELMRRITL